MMMMNLTTFLAFTLLSADAFTGPQTRGTETTTTLSAAISPRPTTTKAAEPVSFNKGLDVKRGEVVLEPYFGIANGILAAAPAIVLQHTIYLGPDGPWTTWNVPAEAAIGAAIHLILGYYVLKQTQRVRCVFDKKSFEFKNIKDNQLVTKPNKNYVKGTINKWDCDAVVDFGYFPSKSYPLITWFKETDTSSAQWGEYGLWGQLFTDPMPNAPAIHFFPGFIDMERWEREMRKRGAQQQ